jgi:hypothetical protein
MARHTAPLEGGLIARKGAAVPARVGAPKPKLIAITVKLDPALYRHLKQIGLQRTPAKTMQQVVVDALIGQYGEPADRIADEREGVV